MKVLLVVMAVALAGCASQKWYRQGAGESEFNREAYGCQQQAASSYPSSFVQQQTSQGYVAPPQPTTTNCTVYGNTANCQSQATGPNLAIYNQPPSYVTIDANQGNRAGAYRSCMFAKGWALK